jgi:hypothetical protein
VWNETSEDVFKYPFRFSQPRLVNPRSGGKDPSIGLTLSDPVRLSRVLPGYLERPGRYFLPSGFIPVRITKLLTNPFPLFYLLPNLKLPVLVLIWGLRAKKIRIRVPTAAAPTAAKPSGRDRNRGFGSGGAAANHPRHHRTSCLGAEAGSAATAGEISGSPRRYKP